MRIRTVRSFIFATMLACAVSLPLRAGAQDTVPQTITNQGRLFDAGDKPVEGSLDVVFAIYDAPEAMTPIWSEKYTITFDQGYYSVSLGSVTPFGAEVFDGSLRYFGITIGGEAELAPRAPIQSVPYALLAGDVRGDIHPGSVSIGDKEVIDENGQWVGDPAGLMGPTGATGPAGPQGAMGPAGLIGPAGPTGATGAEGSMGPMGPAGATGPMGPAGPIGAMGPTGAMGPMGPVGPAGPIGAMGATGATGEMGPIGPVGPMGATGAMGPMGPTGTTGPIGPAGPMGATGAMGPMGLVGPTGAEGPIGPMGSAGATGATGAMGPMGLVGPTGAEGPIGPMGSAGATGAMGPIGATGATGATGPAGTNGSSAVTIRFTRAMPPSGSTLATLDAACLSEYGANYQLADIRDMGTLFGGINYQGIAPSFWANNAGTVNGFVINASTVSTASPSSAPAVCVRIDAKIRYTRTLSSTSATVATLDASCVAAFGAGYQVADIRDFGALLQANVALNLSQPRFLATNQGAAPVVGAFFQGNLNPIQLQQWFGTGSFQVACVRLTP